MKKLYACLLLVISALSTQAQRSFIKQLLLTGGQSMVATNDGGYLLTGAFLIVKYTAADKVAWTVKVKDTMTMEFVKAIPAADGGYAVLSNANSDSYIRPHVSKYDADGKEVWRQAIYGYRGFDIAEDAAGDYVISYVNAGDVYTSHLIKMSAAGTFVWTKSLTSLTSDNFISSIKITGDNHYAVAGAANQYTNVSVFDTAGNQVLNQGLNTIIGLNTALAEFPNGDLLVVTNENNYSSVPGITRLTRQGTVVWQKAVLTKGVFEHYNAAVISDSLITLTGYRTNTSYRDTVLTVAALKGDGAFLWEKQISTPTPAAGVACVRLKDGSYRVLAGRFFYFFSNRIFNESYLVKMTPGGSTCNTTTVPVYAKTIATGTFSSPAYSSYTLNTVTPVLKLSSIPKVTEIAVCDPSADVIAGSASLKPAETALDIRAAFTAKAYPNPAVNSLSVTITLVKPGAITAELTDMYGKRVLMAAYPLPAGSSTRLLNIAQLPAGVYLLKVSDAKEIQTIRIIK